MRCFLQWFLLALAYVAALFLATDSGLLQAIYAADMTRMTVAIAGVFVLVCGYLGVAAWRYDTTRDEATAMADTNLGRQAAFIVTLIGLLGTALGLMAEVHAMASIDLSNPQNVVGLIAAIGHALSTALYATATGIVACIGITLMTLNLEYFLDRDDRGGSA